MSNEKSIEIDAQLARRLELLHERMKLGRSEATPPPDSDEIQAENVEFRDALDALFLIQQVRKEQSASSFPTDGIAETQLPVDTKADFGRRPDLPQQFKQQTIGRFELRELIGRGGYGIVFRAYDSQLDRDVAVKVPHVQIVASAELETRFVREAKAAGALSHPNIVTVFEAGRDEEMLYIASELVEGRSLAQWLSETDSLPGADRIAEFVSVLAAAIGHAHSRGVLHRDLKPGNILLTDDADPEPSSASDQNILDHPRIADFGLAKLEQDPTEATRSGMIIGTPAYMAPEQTIGTQDVGPAADIYGLGAIMYELITGRKPFVGSTILETIQAVKDEPPISPQKLRADVPRDLEAICLKCLEKEPAARYPSASELGADLQRFLKGESVVARPVSTLVQFKRWVKRNRALSRSLFALATVVLVALAITIALLVRSEYHRGIADSKSVELGAEVEAKETALGLLKTRSTQMTRVIDRLFIAIADSPEIRKPENEKLRRRLLTEAEEVYASFLKDTPGDQEFLPDHAELLGRLAQLFQSLGESKMAEELVSQAIDEYQQLENPSSDTLKRLAVQHDFRSAVRIQLGDFDGAEDDIAKSFESLPITVEDVVANPALPAQDRLLLARLVSSQASKESKLGKLTHAKEMATQADVLWLQLKADEFPDPHSSFTFWKGSAYLQLGQIEDMLGDARRSEKLLTEAISLLKKVDQSTLSDHLGAQIRVSQCQWHLGTAYTKQRRFDEARTILEAAIEAQNRLNQEFPNVELYADAMGGTSYSLAVAEYLSRNYQRAEELLQSNIEVNKQMIEKYPDTEGLRWSKIGESYNLIYVINRSKQYDHADVAETAILASIQAHEKCLEIRPGSKDGMMRLNTAEGNWARFLVELDRLDDAQRAVDSAHNRVLEQLRQNPDWEALKRNLGSVYDAYTRLYIKLNDFETAAEYCEKCLQIRRDKTNRLTIFQLAWLLAKTNQMDESEQVLNAFQKDFGHHPIDYVKCANAAAKIAAEFDESEKEYDRFRTHAEKVLTTGFATCQPPADSFVEMIRKEQFLATMFSSEQLFELLNADH